MKQESIIFKALVGSHAYGTNIEGSDKDFKGVYIQSPEDCIEKGYQEQVNINKDETYYELRRFIELSCVGNPTMLELLFMPQDCIEIQHPIYLKLLEHKDKFLSKSCRYSFCGYAYEQIKKAGGLQKKMNWEIKKTERKTVLDFCFVLDGKVSKPLKQWLKENNYKQENCGLTSIPHWRQVYNLFYDHQKEIISDNPRYKDIQQIYKFSGVVLDEETANDISLSSEVPEYAVKEITMCFNRDEYSTHCKEYKEYQTWLNNRNTQRYVDVENHGQKIDGKNLLHCYRLLETGIEIAEQKTINVRRPNADFLIGIRKGHYNLKELLENAEIKMKQLNEAFDKCNLPDKADRGFLLSLMVKLRKEYYAK